MTSSQKGQALLEALVSLPAVVLVFAAITAGIYFNLCYYLTDFWTQESALCLAKNYPKNECLSLYKEKTKILALIHIKMESFNRSDSLIFVKAKATWPTGQFHTFTHQLPWPVQKL